MTLIEKRGDMFTSDAPAYAQGVNCHGVMGAGIAAAFRQRYPEMYFEYRAQCQNDLLLPGMVWSWQDKDTKQIIFNLASQDLPGADARLHWFRRALTMTVRQAQVRFHIDRIAMPMIGCGIGGLQASAVLPVIETEAKVSGIDIEVWTL